MQSRFHDSIPHLRVSGLIAAAVGGVGSIGLMLRAGRHNNSQMLLMIFALWVVSPFVGLVLADAISKRWPLSSRTMLYRAMLAVAAASLVIYGYIVFGQPRVKLGAVFLVVPAASWLVSVALVAFGRWSGR